MYNGTVSQCESDLEEMVDKFSTSTIISILSSIASEKASHVRSNWQDESLAKVWDRMAKTLDRSYMHVNRVDRMLP
jgi:hypothetical protein